MNGNFDKNFGKWLKKNKYSIHLEKWCKYCKRLKKRFGRQKFPKYKGPKKNIPYVPALFKNKKLIHEPIDKIYKKYLKSKKSGSGFGFGYKQKRIQGPVYSGLSYRADYPVPLTNWGKYSNSPWGNRGGNSMPMGKWLMKRNMPPNFPVQKIRNKHHHQFGYNPKNEIIRSSTNKFLDQRGNNGFQKRFNSINQYNAIRDTVPPKGSLPRPYGPRDSFYMKRNLLREVVPEQDLKFGSYSSYRNRSYGPFVNQGYSRFGTYNRSYGPFVNQGYSGFGESKYPSKRQFKPYMRRSWNPKYNSYANKNLYARGYNPYQVDPENHPFPKKVPGKISRKFALNNFGLDTYKMMGGNNVAYRSPFLMYTGGDSPGGNTINWSTKMNYLPKYKDPPVKRLKVKQNNNPRGYLSNSKVTPVSGLGKHSFGSRPKRPKRPKRTKNNFGLQDFEESNAKAHQKILKNFPMYQSGVNLFNDGKVSGTNAYAQPLELYNYMNNPDVGSYNYPEFSGPRNFYGGFGEKSKKVKKRKSKVRSNKIKAGDTLILKNGKLKVQKKINNK